MFTQKSHYSATTDVASDVNVLLRGCSSGRQSTQGSLSISGWPAAPGARILGPAAFVLSSLSSFTGNKSWYSRRKDLVWELQCRVNLPFPLAKHCILSSEKRCTSVSCSREAGWQDARYRNKLTQSLHLAAILIFSQAVLTMYVCLFGVFKVTLNYLQGKSLPKSIADREEGCSDRSWQQQDGLTACSPPAMRAALS